jgi:peptide/nickel transport system permease protein
MTRALSFVPGAAGVWFCRLAGAVFYLYFTVLLVRFDVLVNHFRNPILQGRVSAWIVVAGLMAIYAASVLPVLLAKRPSGRYGIAYLQRFKANRMAVLGLVLVLLFLNMSMLAPLLSPHNPEFTGDPVEERYQAPSLSHPMGTDRFGRDILSRVLYGSRVSLAVGVLAVTIASLFGLLIGAFSGYMGGRVDDVAMRIVDGFLAFPRLLLVLTLLAFFADSLWLMIVLLGVTGWMRAARLVRAEVLSLKEREFIQAAVATGIGRARIVLKHLGPSTLGPVLVAATLQIGRVILLESNLSFLGLGVQPPTPSWGIMVFDGRDVLVSAWWVSGFPGIAIVLAVVACNLLGDGLRDAMDVKQGGAS